MKTSRTIVVTVLIETLFALAATARQIEPWEYDKLFREADLVVIASARSTVDTADQSTNPRWATSLVGQETTFKVHKTLQGNAVAEGDELKVAHFRLKQGVATANGPSLVKFRIKGLTFHGRVGNTEDMMAAGIGPPQDLLFLRKTPGGPFEPVSGQVDPRLSVKEIYAPLFSDLDRPDDPVKADQ